MPSPPHEPAAPDPAGRTSPEGAAPAEAGAPVSGSTGSHHPAPLSDILRKSGTIRRSTGSDVLRALANPGASPVAPQVPPSNPDINSDEAPTVITRLQPSSGQLPTPLPLAVVTGDTPSVAGRRLGHFELIEAIGAGGMAAVLKARDLELGRIVALKILPPEAAPRPGKRHAASIRKPAPRPGSTTRTSPASTSAARIRGCTSSPSSSSRATTCGTARPPRPAAGPASASTT